MGLLVGRGLLAGGSLVVRKPLSLLVGKVASLDDTYDDGIESGPASGSGGNGVRIRGAQHSRRCGAFTWSGGTVDGNGVVELSGNDRAFSTKEGSAVVINGTAPKILSGGISLLAANTTVVWESGDVLLSNHSSLQVAGPWAKLVGAPRQGFRACNANPRALELLGLGAPPE